MNKFKKGDRVFINSKSAYDGRLVGMMGIVEKVYDSQRGVFLALDVIGAKNPKSGKGLFYVKPEMVSEAVAMPNPYTGINVASCYSAICNSVYGVMGPSSSFKGLQRIMYVPTIKKVYFNFPYTIVIWADGSKTKVKCQEGDFYTPETGLALCISKKALGNTNKWYNVFKKHLPTED